MRNRLINTRALAIVNKRLFHTLLLVGSMNAIADDIGERCRQPMLANNQLTLSEISKLPKWYGDYFQKFEKSNRYDDHQYAQLATSSDGRSTVKLEFSDLAWYPEGRESEIKVIMGSKDVDPQDRWYDGFTFPNQISDSIFSFDNKKIVVYGSNHMYEEVWPSAFLGDLFWIDLTKSKPILIKKGLDVYFAGNTTAMWDHRDQRIVYAAGVELFIYSIAEGASTNVVGLGHVNEEKFEKRYQLDSCTIIDPVWSPDDNEIVFKFVTLKDNRETTARDKYVQTERYYLLKEINNLK